MAGVTYLRHERLVTVRCLDDAVVLHRHAADHEHVSVNTVAAAVGVADTLDDRVPATILRVVRKQSHSRMTV